MDLSGPVARWQAAARATFTRELITAGASGAPAVRRVVYLERELRKALNEADLFYDPLWMPIRRRAYRSALLLQTLPLPQSSLGLAEASAEILAGISTADPGRETESARVLATELQALHDGTADPLSQAVISVLEPIRCDLEEAAVLLADQRFGAEVAAHLASIFGAPVAVMSGRELASRDAPLDSLVVVGPARLHPRHLLTAPRTECTCFVQFDWIKDEPDPVVLGGRRAPGWPRAISEQLSPISCGVWPGSGEHDLTSLIPADYLSRSFDWGGLAAAARQQEPHHSRVAAVPLLLADSWVVWIPTAAERITVVDPYAPPSERVHERSLGEVGRGTFVAFRLEGGGDMVAELADREFLKGDAPRLRERQEAWKNLLRRKVTELGAEHVAMELKRLGATETANASNVERWSSPEGIKMQNRQDFEAVLKLVGAEGDAAAWWNDMRRILSAHLRAARRIRAMLDAKIRAGEGLHALVETGFAEIELDTTAGGTLGVFLVTGRGDTHEIPQTQLRAPIRLDVDNWVDEVPHGAHDPIDLRHEVDKESG